MTPYVVTDIMEKKECSNSGLRVPHKKPHKNRSELIETNNNNKKNCLYKLYSEKWNISVFSVRKEQM